MTNRYTDRQKRLLSNASGTGWISGGALAKQSPNTASFDVTTDCRIQMETYSAGAVREYLVPAQNGIATGMLANEERFIMVKPIGDPLGSTFQFSFIQNPTPKESRESAQIGRVWMDNAGNVSGIFQYVQPAWGGLATQSDVIRATTTVRVGTGNTHSLHATEKALAKTSGEDFRWGAWAGVTPDNPNSGVDAAVARMPEYEMVRSDSFDAVSLVTDIPTSQFEDLSDNTIKAIPNNRWVVSPVCWFPRSNFPDIQFSQGQQFG